MARIVIVLICGVLVFILVSRFAPHFIETYLPSAGSQEQVAESETPDAKAEAAKKKSVASKAKAPTAATRSSAQTQAAPAISAAPVLPTPMPPFAATPANVPAAPARSVVQVTSENATVYLTNTTGGPVIGRLTKGAVVEPVFVVNSAGQNWTFVSASNEELAGFMRSDTLGRGKIAASAAK